MELINVPFMILIVCSSDDLQEHPLIKAMRITLKYFAISRSIETADHIEHSYLRGFKRRNAKNTYLLWSMNPYC